MIICVCNNINSETIKMTLDTGATSVQDVREKTGAADCCGKCQFKINGMIQSHLDGDSACASFAERSYK